jgi:Ca2+-binding EF-hand superfamily protein
MWDSGSSTRFAFQGVTVVQEPVLLGYRDQASKIALYRQTERPVSPKPSVFARVWVKEAKDLMASDVSVMTGVRSSDPLCRVTLTPNGMPKSTGNYIGCLSADWNTFLTVESAPLHWNDSVDDINLELCVMDKDLLTGDDPLGVINIPVMEKYFEEKAKRIQSGQTSRYRDDESWLLVRVLRASNLPATDFEEVENEETGEIEIERSSDPYVKLECNGQLWGTAPVEGTINPNFLANGEEPFWFRVYNENNIMERFEKEWGEVVEKLPVKVIGYKGSVNMNELAGTKESKEGREGKSGEGKSGEGSKFGKETKIGESKLDESKVQGVQKILTVAEEKELENKRLRQQARQEMVMKNVESIKVVMLEYYQLLCDGFNFYSTWDDVCEEARIKEEERSERHKRREIRKRRREKKEAERRALVKAAMAEKNEKLKKAREWMNSSLRKEQEGIQLRIAEKFHMLINERNQSIRDIFVAFDEDGGGTIDPEELRDGFDALDVELSDYEFERMWEVWDEDGGGEIDFDEFTEMFNKTLVVLEAKLELEKEEKLKEARKWMGDSMRTEQKRIQLRIAEKFRMLRHERNQTVEQIFTTFDEDGGGTIDPEEMREGFDALGVMLTDVEFEKMWEIWDESGDGEGNINFSFDFFVEINIFFKRT